MSDAKSNGSQLEVPHVLLLLIMLALWLCNYTEIIPIPGYLLNNVFIHYLSCFIFLFLSYAVTFLAVCSNLLFLEFKSIQNRYFFTKTSLLRKHSQTPSFDRIEKLISLLTHIRIKWLFPFKAQHSTFSFDCILLFFMENSKVDVSITLNCL